MILICVFRLRVSPTFSQGLSIIIIISNSNRDCSSSRRSSSCSSSIHFKFPWPTLNADTTSHLSHGLLLIANYIQCITTSIKR